MNRRSIIAGLIGSPIAASGAADALRASGVGLAPPAPPAGGWALEAASKASSRSSASIVNDARKLGLINDSSLFDVAREDAGWPSTFDPDLAANKSLSLYARCLIQRERDIARRVQRWSREDDGGFWGLVNRLREIVP